MKHSAHIECIKTIYVSINTLFIFMLVSGCASIPPSSSIAPPDQAKLKKIIENISQNTTPVSTFISSGRVTSKNWAWGSEAKTMIVGQREPLQLKIELTHSWGRPILHILIKEENIEVLSFFEDRLYRGIYSPESLSKFIQVSPEIDQLWSILRGYPEVKPYDSLKVKDHDHLVLIDQTGKEQEEIGFDLESFKISSILFPGSDLKISFSEYSTEEGISYASKIGVNIERTGKTFILTHETMVFNREIPTKIFELRIPPDFEIIDLGKISGKTPTDRIKDNGH